MPERTRIAQNERILTGPDNFSGVDFAEFVVGSLRKVWILRICCAFASIECDVIDADHAL